MKRLKCAAVLLSVLALLLSLGNSALATVLYDGGIRDFVFDPGTGEALTDMFPGFQDLMPGDTVTQQLVIRSEAGKKVKLRVWVRAVPPDEESRKLLDQLQLRVVGPKDNVLFEAPAGETAQLTEWVKLGTLRSGGEVTLTAILAVPLQLSNELQDAAGYIKWEFKAEELPVGSGSQTGDDAPVLILVLLGLAGLLGIAILIFISRREKKRPVSAEEPEETKEEPKS